jgi:exopolysaccharide biosynthesis polyprenyl glycosylphosphotransferase
MHGRSVPSQAADRAVEPGFSVSTLTRKPGSGSLATARFGGRSQPGITPRRGWLVRRALLAADVCGLILAFVTTELLLGSPDGSGSFQQLAAIGEVAIFALTLPLWILLAKLYGLYDRDEERPAHTTVDDLSGVVHLTTIGLWSVTVGAWLTHLIAPDFAKLVFFWILAVTFIVLARCVARATVRRTAAYRQRTLIVGADRSARLLTEKLSRHPESGIDVIACLSEQPNDRLDGIPVVGAPEDLLSIVSELDIERVIFARLDEAEVSTIIRPLRSTDVQVDMVVCPLEAVAPDTRVHMLDGIPILGVSSARLSHSSVVLKRTMDIALSGIALVLLSPVLAVIALLIKLDSRGPVLYRHDRIGRDRQPFRLLKFRTMQAEYCRGNGYGGEEAEQEFARLMDDPARRQEFESSYKLLKDPRVTRIGTFLRRTSLDELPQLFNVLRGDLSLVGPRPIVAAEVGRYGSDAAAVLSLRPGVTGYWQVSGRSDTSYAERIRLDTAYASNWSLQLDLSILLHTVRVLFLSRPGAY